MSSRKSTNAAIYQTNFHQSATIVRIYIAVPFYLLFATYLTMYVNLPRECHASLQWSDLALATYARRILELWKPTVTPKFERIHSCII